MAEINKVLIADDEPVGRQLLEAVLYSEGFELFFAETGQQAFDMAVSLYPDLILLDVMMPDMDGFDVCKKLRNHEQLRNVPIFLITALDDRDSKLRGLDAGADDYISKPFDRVEILAKVKNTIQLDRYKQIISKSDQNKDDLRANKKTDDGLEHILLSIQKSIIPDKEYFLQHDINSFALIYPVNIVNPYLSWGRNIDNTLYYAAFEQNEDSLIGALHNICFTTRLNSIINKSDKINLDEIIYSIQKVDEDYVIIDHVNFVLLSINTNLKELIITGKNYTIYHLNEQNIQEILITGDHYSTKTKSIAYNKGDSIYLFSSFFYDKIKNITFDSGKNIQEFLITLQSVPFNDCENKIKDSISQFISSNTSIKNYFIVGMQL